MKEKNSIFILIPLIPAILYLNIFNYEKKLYVSTIIYFLIIAISKYFFDKKYLTKGKYIVNETLFFVILFLFVIITQNRFLNIETITWDISSYLVASNEIDKGFLPLETQWESKGPLTIYIYYLLSKIVGNNYVYFKLINDIILYISIIGLFFIGKKLKISRLKTITASFSVASIFSIQWFVSEFTEFYCLPLIVLANYLHVKNNKQLQKYIGFLFGLSFLINQGSILFFLPIVIDNLKANYKIKKDFSKTVLNYFFGFFTPILFFIFIYWKNNLLDILIANYFDIPLGYVGENASSFYELRVFLREISILNQFTYFFIITLFFFYLVIIFKEYKFELNKLFDLINLNIVFSLLYYFIAGHNFYHHLIYFVYFSIFLIFKIKQRFQLNLIFLLIFLSSLNSLYLSYSSSYDNLSNLSKTYENYPLKNLAKSIDSNFEDKSYTVFALDFVLILDYLNKTIIPILFILQTITKVTFLMYWLNWVKLRKIT